MGPALVLAIGLYLVLAVMLKNTSAAEGNAKGGDVDTADLKSQFEEIYQRHGRRFNVDPILLRAEAIVESSENPLAKNPADPSYGLMQILARTDADGTITNKFNIIGWPPISVDQLLDPDVNVFFGAQILSWNIKTFGFRRGIATYNRWESRLDPVNGPFGNQGYVNKVMNRFKMLGGDEAKKGRFA